MKPIKLSTSIDINKAWESLDDKKPITVSIDVSNYTDVINFHGANVPFEWYLDSNDTVYHRVAQALLYEMINQFNGSIIEPPRLFVSGLEYDSNLVEFFGDGFYGDEFIGSVIEFVFDDTWVKFKFVKSFEGFDSSTISPIIYWENNPKDIIDSFLDKDVEMLITGITCYILQFEIEDIKSTINIPVFSEYGVLTR